MPDKIGKFEQSRFIEIASPFHASMEAFAASFNELDDNSRAKIAGPFRELGAQWQDLQLGIQKLADDLSALRERN